MRYSFVGKDTVISEALKEKTMQKMSKLEKFIPEDTEVSITYSVTKLENKIEVTMPIQKRILRAEARQEDMYAAVDQVVDILENQMIKYKGRLKDKSRRDKAFKEELATVFTDILSESENKDAIEIKRTKRFGIKPMDSEEAVMEMELLNHDFYVFRNTENDEVNVVYKRNDGTYGLIEPEF